MIVPLQDIRTRDDINLLVEAFYQKVFKNFLLQPFFQHIPPDVWNIHLHTMVRFWNDILFYTAEYSGNPMIVHADLFHRMTVSTLHFEEWVKLFNETVDDLYEGEKATLAKTRARSIASVMSLKLKI